MQKSYVIILFCFFITNNVIAQLPNDLVRLARTLKNVAAKLVSAVEPSEPTVYTIPLSNEITLSDGKSIEAPAGSIVEIRNTGILVKVKIPDVESTIKLSSAGFLELSGEGSVQFPDGSVDYVPVKGFVIEFLSAGTIKIKPKNLIPPVPPGTFSDPNDVIRLDVPAHGFVALPNGEFIKVPLGSKVLIYSNGLEITVPYRGGDVQLPSTGGRIGIDYMFNATLQLPDGSIKEISSDEYAKIFMQGVVRVIPKNTLPPVHDYISSLVSKTINVPHGGNVKLTYDTSEVPYTLDIQVPKNSIIHQLYDGLAVTVSATGGDVTIPFWGSYVGLPKGSPAVTVELSDGRKGEIVGGGYIIVPEGTTKIRPKIIVPEERKTIKIPSLPEE